MSSKTLDLSNVINVTILGTPTGLNLPLINTAALFSSETPSWGDAFKIYLNATDVGTDFGTGSKAYSIARAFFAQQPNPLGTGGYLTIVPLVGGTEAVATAIARVLNSVYFFGVLVDQEYSATPAVFSALATYVQTLDKVFFYASSVQSQYSPGGMLDLIRSGSLTNTRCLYYSDGTALDTQLMAAAYAGRALSTDFTGSNTAQSLHLKALSGITADTTVDQTQLTALQTAGVDCYVSVAGVSGIFNAATNGFFDEIYNQFWLKFALQTAGLNYLRQTNSKIPQTEPGMEGLKNEYRKVCAQGVSNGFLAPGTWTSSTVFGSSEALIRCVKDIGYYIYSSPISAQTQVNREARIAPLVQIAVKTAGAIHKSNVIVQVNL